MNEAIKENARQLQEVVSELKKQTGSKAALLLVGGGGAGNIVVSECDNDYHEVLNNVLDAVAQAARQKHANAAEAFAADPSLRVHEAVDKFEAKDADNGERLRKVVKVAEGLVDQVQKSTDGWIDGIAALSCAIALACSVREAVAREEGEDGSDSKDRARAVFESALQMNVMTALTSDEKKAGVFVMDHNQVGHA